MLSDVKYLSQVLRILLILENLYKMSIKRYVTLVKEKERIANFHANLADNYLLRVSNRNTRTMCDIFSKLIIKTRKHCQRSRSGVLIVTYKQI